MILTLKRFQVMLAYQMRLSSTKNAFMLAVNEWVNVCRILFTFMNVIIIWRLKPYSLHLGQNHPFHIYPKIELAIEEIGLNQQIRTLKQKRKMRMKNKVIFTRWWWEEKRGGKKGPKYYEGDHSVGWIEEEKKTSMLS